MLGVSRVCRSFFSSTLGGLALAAAFLAPANAQAIEAKKLANELVAIEVQINLEEAIDWQLCEKTFRANGGSFSCTLVEQELGYSVLDSQGVRGSFPIGFEVRESKARLLFQDYGYQKVSNDLSNDSELPFGQPVKSYIESWAKSRIALAKQNGMSLIQTLRLAAFEND